MIKVYLADLEGFYSESEEEVKNRLSILKNAGIELTNITPEDDDKPKDIYMKTIEAIENSNAVIANVSPFRGPHSYNGSAFVLGYANALGKPTVAYSNNTSSLINKIGSLREDSTIDHDGIAIENYDLTDTLLVVESISDLKVHSLFIDAVEALKEFFN
jgi:nucleoside 2-deoxyribosyltransferase